MKFTAYTIKVENQNEDDAIRHILDWATRHAGVNAAVAVAHFVNKIEASKAVATGMEKIMARSDATVEDAAESVD